MLRESAVMPISDLHGATFIGHDSSDSAANLRDKHNSLGLSLYRP